MKLWLIQQDTNTNYDSFDSAVVCADTAEQARQMDPSGELGEDAHRWSRYSWIEDLTKVSVVCIGEASPEIEFGVVLASFNAG